MINGWKQSLQKTKKKHALFNLCFVKFSLEFLVKISPENALNLIIKQTVATTAFCKKNNSYYDQQARKRDS